jgi:hypothetical protein
MVVTLGHNGAAVPEHVLYLFHGHTGIEHVRGEGVTQRVRVDMSRAGIPAGSG